MSASTVHTPPSDLASLFDLRTGGPSRLQSPAEPMDEDVLFSRSPPGTACSHVQPHPRFIGGVIGMDLISVTTEVRSSRTSSVSLSYLTFI